MKRILAGGNALKALDLTRSRVSDTFSVLLDHSIRPVQYGLRDYHADLFCSLQIDNELKLGRLFHG
jgi:hypothetical protein